MKCGPLYLRYFHTTIIDAFSGPVFQIPNRHSLLVWVRKLTTDSTQTQTDSHARREPLRIRVRVVSEPQTIDETSVVVYLKWRGRPPHRYSRAYSREWWAFTALNKLGSIASDPVRVACLWYGARRTMYGITHYLWPSPVPIWCVPYIIMSVINKQLGPPPNNVDRVLLFGRRVTHTSSRAVLCSVPYSTTVHKRSFFQNHVTRSLARSDPLPPPQHHRFNACYIWT